MKRTVVFDILEDKYSLADNGKEIFCVDRNSFQFDVKAFYQAFFAEGLDYSEIEFECNEALDKAAAHVYNTIKQLTADICKRLSEDITVDDLDAVPGGDPNENE